MKAILIAALALFISQKGFAQNPPAIPETHAESSASDKMHEPEHGAGAIEHHEAGEEHRDNAALFPKKQADVKGQGTAPKAVTLSEPAFGAKIPAGTVTLSWAASEGADAYHIQIATDPNFKWLKTDEHFVKDTKFQIGGLEANKKFYWRVAPWKDANMAQANKGPFANSTFETK